MAILALPAAAPAAYLVPPENSAAAQYTEAYPTAGGNQEAGKGQKRGNRSPAAVLGAGNARRLHAQGPEGREVAEVVAATAPGVETASEPQPAAEPATSAPGHGKKNEAAHPPFPATGNAPGSSEGPRPALDQPGGSSGLGEVIGQATGSSSSGDLGLLLPLAIFGTVAWSLAFLWRQRKKPTS